MSTRLSPTFVNTPDQLSLLVDTMKDAAQANQDEPSIYVDLEGIKLSRNGSISIITILLQLAGHLRIAYLVDVFTLGSQTFTTTGKENSGHTLKSLFEDVHIVKVFFDVRNDSDALYSKFGIALQGVQDVQLMESAARTAGSRKFLGGLANCIKRDTVAGDGDKSMWELTKAYGEILFSPEKGGSYEVFNQRPLSEIIMAYCVGDVQYLPLLREKYWGMLTKEWRERVDHETRQRVLGSQQPTYQPHGEHKKFAPWARRYMYAAR